jgi:hypothetical protein
MDQEISYVQFGILSSNDIKKLSVCEITSTKLSGAGSVYDPRMGNSSTTDSEEIVTNNYIYTIESNDSNFSLNLNYNPNSTMNFRVFAPSS